MSVAIGAQYTKETRQYNGLDALEKTFVEEALNGTPTRRYAVVAYEVTDLNINVRKGERQPRVSIVNIETMHGEDATAAKAMLDKEFRYRTGRMDAPADTLFDDPDASGGQPAIEGAGTVDGEGPGTEWPVVDGETAGDESVEATGSKPRRRGGKPAEPAVESA